MQAIFAARKFKNLPLFDTTMVNKRWLKSTSSAIEMTNQLHDPNIHVYFQIGTNINSQVQGGTVKAAAYNEVL